MIVPLIIIYFLCAILYRAGVRNVVMNASVLDVRHRLFSDLPRFGYLFVWSSATSSSSFSRWA